ncbi:MAG: hypothetical protein LBU28_02675, partial [Spirochaetaceae bacterium]|nr:hypothetical protein [Spirochaetaceae bacterium]
MMKRSLIFVLIAVCSAIFVLTGCPTDGGGDDGGGTPPVNPDTGIAIDHTSPSAARLKEDLLNTDHPEWQAIGFDIAGGGDLDVNTVIPVGKTLVLQNSGAPATKAVIGSNNLVVDGTLIVSNSTGISATTAGKLFIGREGRVEVQPGGRLLTDERKSVTNFVGDSIGANSALTTSQVRFAGGTILSIGAESELVIDDITPLLAILPEGTSSRAVNVPVDPSKLELVQPQTKIKPSDIARLAPSLSAARHVALTPAAKDDETITALTIPAGAEVTVTVGLSTIKTLVVEGILDAPSIGGADAVAVTVSAGASLTVKEP